MSDFIEVSMVRFRVEKNAICDGSTQYFAGNLCLAWTDNQYNEWRVVDLNSNDGLYGSDYDLNRGLTPFEAADLAKESALKTWKIIKGEKQNA